MGFGVMQNYQEDFDGAGTVTLQMESYKIADSRPAWIAHIRAKEETLLTSDQSTTIEARIIVVGEQLK